MFLDYLKQEDLISSRYGKRSIYIWDLQEPVDIGIIVERNGREVDKRKW